MARAQLTGKYSRSHPDSVLCEWLSIQNNLSATTRISMHLNSSTLENQLEKVKELESRLTFRLSVVSKLLDQHSQALLKGTPLSLPSYRILAVVHTFERISISDISRFNAMDRAQVSRAAVELEKQGYVDFRSDPVSKRKKIVILTDKGYAILAQVQPKFDQYRATLEDALGRSDVDALSTGLARLTAHLGERKDTNP